MFYFGGIFQPFLYKSYFVIKIEKIFKKEKYSILFFLPFHSLDEGTDKYLGLDVGINEEDTGSEVCCLVPGARTLQMDRRPAEHTCARA